MSKEATGPIWQRKMLSQLGAGCFFFFVEMNTGIKVTKLLNRVKLQIHMILMLTLLKLHFKKETNHLHQQTRNPSASPYLFI